MSRKGELNIHISVIELCHHFFHFTHMFSPMKRGQLPWLKSSRNRGYHGGNHRNHHRNSQVLLSVARNLGTLATHAQRCGQQLAVPWWNYGRLDVISFGNWPGANIWISDDFSGFRWNFTGLKWIYLDETIDLDMGFELPVINIPVGWFWRWSHWGSYTEPGRLIQVEFHFMDIIGKTEALQPGSCQLQVKFRGTSLIFLCLDQLGVTTSVDPSCFMGHGHATSGGQHETPNISIWKWVLWVFSLSLAFENGFHGFSVILCYFDIHQIHHSPVFRTPQDDTGVLPRAEFRHRWDLPAFSCCWNASQPDQKPPQNHSRKWCKHV